MCCTHPPSFPSSCKGSNYFSSNPLSLLGFCGCLPNKIIHSTDSLPQDLSILAVIPSTPGILLCLNLSLVYTTSIFILNAPNAFLQVFLVLISYPHIPSHISCSRCPLYLFNCTGSFSMYITMSFRFPWGSPLTYSLLLLMSTFFLTKTLSVLPSPASSSLLIYTSYISSPQEFWESWLKLFALS